MLSIAQKLILATLLTWPLLCGLAQAQTFFLPDGGVGHQVTTTSTFQTLPASCDPSVGVTEWDFLLSHSFTAPTITLGAGCRNSQQLIVRVIQDATGGIAPSLAAASGVTISWQANGGSQPSLTTTANASDMMKFTLSTYPSGTNLILTSWLPSLVPSVAAVGSCIGSGLTQSLTGTGPTCTTLGQPKLFTSGTSYATPSGATLLDVTLVGAGGGGGGATSGGATSESGGGGGGGGITKFLVYSPSGSYTYSLGTGGTAGGCSATPTAAGNGGNSTFIVGAVTVTVGGGSGGVTATTGAGGTGGAGATAATGLAQLYGIGQALTNAGGSAGGNGGTNANVISGGAVAAVGGSSTAVSSGTCIGTAATAGQNGFMIVTAYGTY